MSKRPVTILSLTLLLTIGLVDAATQTQPPSTDVFVADLRHRDGRLAFESPLNITNRDGYDNQPYFLPDGDGLLFTSIRDGSLPDIYRYKLSDKSTAQMTRTAEG